MSLIADTGISNCDFGQLLAHQCNGLIDPLSLPQVEPSMQCNAALHLLHACYLSLTHVSDAGAGAVTMPGFRSDVCRSLHQSFMALADHYGVPPERQYFMLYGKHSLNAA